MRASCLVLVGMRPVPRFLISIVPGLKSYAKVSPMWKSVGKNLHVHKQANVLTPSIFIAQLPQIPSLQLLLNVNVGSTSFLILISASNIIGPVLFRSNV